MKAVIFAMDGVLVKSEPLYLTMNQKFFRELGAASGVLPRCSSRFGTAIDSAPHSVASRFLIVTSTVSRFTRCNDSSENFISEYCQTTAVFTNRRSDKFCSILLGKSGSFGGGLLQIFVTPKNILVQLLVVLYLCSALARTPGPSYYALIY